MSDAGERLRAILAEVSALLAEERRLCLAGRLDEAGPLAERKQLLIERLAEAMAAITSEGTGAEERQLRDEIRSLHRAARENERLLEAARTGLKRARRELARLAAARRGAVAYGADGEEILSREDAAGRSKTA
ncbi:MAG: hypothetical protein AAFQ75_10265 [Pseudomonadota bacterium]